MLRALRVVSVERGHDPRDFALVAYGGAGPLHACSLAEELGIRTVLVPDVGGRAVRARARRERRAARPRASRTWCRCDEAGELPRDGEADLRYAGQSFELTIPLQPDLAAAFHRAHEERYGYADRDARDRARRGSHSRRAAGPDVRAVPRRSRSPCGDLP